MLEAMCWIVRGKYKQNKKVIGIATEMKICPTCSYDFAFLNLPEWTEEFQKHTDELQNKTGIFVNSVIKQVREDEYPKVDANKDT